MSKDGLGVGCGGAVMAVSGFIESVSTAVSVGSLAIDLLLNFFLVSESVSLLEPTLIVSLLSFGGA